MNTDNGKAARPLIASSGGAAGENRDAKGELSNTGFFNEGKVKVYSNCNRAGGVSKCSNFSSGDNSKFSNGDNNKNKLLDGNNNKSEAGGNNSKRSLKRHRSSDGDDAPNKKRGSNNDKEKPKRPQGGEDDIGELAPNKKCGSNNDQEKPKRPQGGEADIGELCRGAGFGQGQAHGESCADVVARAVPFLCRRSNVDLGGLNAASHRCAHTKKDPCTETTLHRCSREHCLATFPTAVAALRHSRACRSSEDPDGRDLLCLECLACVKPHNKTSLAWKCNLATHMASKHGFAIDFEAEAGLMKKEENWVVDKAVGQPIGIS